MHDDKDPVNKYEQEKVSKDKCKPMQRIFSKFLSENLYIYLHSMETRFTSDNATVSVPESC